MTMNGDIVVPIGRSAVRPSELRSTTKRPRPLAGRAPILSSAKSSLISGRVSETGSQSDCFLEFCPSEMISKISLQEIRLGLVRRCHGLTPFGNEHDTLSKLILR
jgi:hypothetical protein